MNGEGRFFDRRQGNSFFHLYFHLYAKSVPKMLSVYAKMSAVKSRKYTGTCFGASLEENAMLPKKIEPQRFRNCVQYAGCLGYFFVKPSFIFHISHFAFTFARASDFDWIETNANIFSGSFLP